MCNNILRKASKSASTVQEMKYAKHHEFPRKRSRTAFIVPKKSAQSLVPKGSPLAMTHKHLARKMALLGSRSTNMTITGPASSFLRMSGNLL